MKTNQAITDRGHSNECRYGLRRGVGYWALVIEGREAIFKHELGALYVEHLLSNPSPDGLHAVALALKARDRAGQAAGQEERAEERSMGLEDAARVRALWRRQRELERVLEDRLAIEPVKAEALRELEEVTEHLRQSPWLSRRGAERCVEAVTLAIKRFHAHLAEAVDADGRPNEVLRTFALHLWAHLLLPSGKGCGRAGQWAGSVPAGCFTYVPPQGVVWKCGMRSAECGLRGAKIEVRGSKLSLSPSEPVRFAAVSYLSRFLCVGFALAILATGCAGPRPLKGGKAVTTRKPGGAIEQVVLQGENPNRATRQTQDCLKVRTYTVPAGSRIEQSQIWEGERPREPKLPKSSAEIRAREDARPPASPQPSTINSQPSTICVLSAPMPVVEREETHAGTELGAAQKDTARELGAKLSSLKGIVWVGVGLFVFGIGSLVWPPLKLIIGSVTTSAALMLGGVALMVLPTLVVGNELLILGGVVLAVGGWFLAHRHGHLRGLVAGQQSSVTSGQ